MQVKKWINEGFSDYELVDAGGGLKFERWKNVHTIRPELQAYFKPEHSLSEWKNKSNLEFSEEKNQSGVWKGEPNSWHINYENLTLKLECTKFKHVGIFPEQAINWTYIKSHLDASKRFLNLFAYTGVASLVARSTGAEVVHVDSVKHLISWAKENMELSNLSEIKWVLEDALKFAQREAKRGNKYDGIVMDPPAWGIGAKGEKWKIEQKLPELIEVASQLLNPGGFLILNTYSPRVSIETIRAITETNFPESNMEIGELWSVSTTKKRLFHGHLMRIVK